MPHFVPRCEIRSIEWSCSGWPTNCAGHDCGGFGDHRGDYIRHTGCALSLAGRCGCCSRCSCSAGCGAGLGGGDDRCFRILKHLCQTDTSTMFWLMMEYDLLLFTLNFLGVSSSWTSSTSIHQTDCVLKVPGHLVECAKSLCKSCRASSETRSCQHSLMGTRHAPVKTSYSHPHIRSTPSTCANSPPRPSHPVRPPCPTWNSQSRRSPPLWHCTRTQRAKVPCTSKRCNSEEPRATARVVQSLAIAPCKR